MAFRLRERLPTSVVSGPSGTRRVRSPAAIAPATDSTSCRGRSERRTTTKPRDPTATSTSRPSPSSIRPSVWTGRSTPLSGMAMTTLPCCWMSATSTGRIVIRQCSEPLADDTVNGVRPCAAAWA